MSVPGLASCSPYVRLVHDYRRGAGGRLPSRRINDHALLFVRGGRGLLVIGARELPLEPGVAMILPPDVDHRIDSGPGAALHLLNVHFDPVARPDSPAV